MLRLTNGVFALMLSASGLVAQGLNDPDASRLLHSVADKYQSLGIYEFEGEVDLAVPDTSCTVEYPIYIAAAPPKYPQEIQFRMRKMATPCRDAVAKLGKIRSPGQWADFAMIQTGVVNVKEFPPQKLLLADGEIQCNVLEVTYDDDSGKVRSLHGPIRYWVDSKTHLIRKAEFADHTPDGGLLFWTAVIEKIRLGGPVASWLTNETDWHWNPPALIGKPAPDFELWGTDGKLVSLKELEGKTVMLVFWATWCGPCVEELPVLENLQSQTKSSQIVLLGITDEKADTVRHWLVQNNRTFQTLVDGKLAFDKFGITPRPVVVTIDGRGIIRSYQLAPSEQELKALIEHYQSKPA